MIIFDTNFLIALTSRSKKRSEKTREIYYKLRSEDNLCVTTFVNMLEIYRGIYDKNNDMLILDSVNAIKDLFGVLDFSEDYYPIYGRLYSKLKAEGTPAGRFDDIIATIAIYHNAKIVTNDTDFQKIQALPEYSNLEIITY